jgi:hypothetical protein
VAGGLDGSNFHGSADYAPFAFLDVLQNAKNHNNILLLDINATVQL